MARRYAQFRPADSEPIGQDSFMDVVANLVGILLILIMVVGYGAKQALRNVAADPTDESQPPEYVVRAQTAAHDMESDIRVTQAQIDVLSLETEARRAQRDQLLASITMAQRLLDEHRQTLSSQQQQEHEQRMQLARVEAQLQEVEAQRSSLEQQLETPGILEHVPTPLATTVFGDEQHFRLSGGKLTRVPINEFLTKLREEAPEKAIKLKDVPEITETLGPLDGFTVRYTLVRRQQSLMTSAGMAVREIVELDQFALLPVSADLGLAIDEQLRDGSWLDRQLQQWDPEKVTITIWTYPDSFREFRRLKEWLYARKFLSAGRPMPADQPIMGSPRGSRSASQ